MTTKEKAAAVLKATKYGRELPMWQVNMLMYDWKSIGSQVLIDQLYRRYCDKQDGGTC